MKRSTRHSVETITTLTLGPAGEMVLPVELRERYGFSPDRPIRVIETQAGILLVPLVDVPMSKAMAEELAEWQALGVAAWEMFPYGVGPGDSRD